MSNTLRDNVRRKHSTVNTDQFNRLKPWCGSVR